MALAAAQQAQELQLPCLVRCVVEAEQALPLLAGLQPKEAVVVDLEQAPGLEPPEEIPHGAAVAEAAVEALVERLVEVPYMAVPEEQEQQVRSMELPVRNLVAAEAALKRHSAARGATASASSPFTD